MTDAINLYPLSSCVCENPKQSYPLPSGFKSNLSFRGCATPSYFSVYNTALVQEDIEPSEKKGYNYLNKQVYSTKEEGGYTKIPCQINSTCKDTYISPDPRLYSSTRNDYIYLDTPPINSDVKLRNIYRDEYNGYGQGPMPYETIRDGQIMYYIDKSIEDVFYKPVYSDPAIHEMILTQDPMGAIYPNHNRIPLMNTQNPTITTCNSYPYKLSFIQDSSFFRNDITALQQRKRNESKYSARWGDLQN